MSTAYGTFQKLYSEIEHEIPWDVAWAKSNSAMAAGVPLEAGELGRTFDPNDNRRFVLVGTPFETILIFECGRPKSKNRKNARIAVRVGDKFSDNLATIIGRESITSSTSVLLEHLVGRPKLQKYYPNIGTRLKYWVSHLLNGTPDLERKSRFDFDSTDN